MADTGAAGRVTGSHDERTGDARSVPAGHETGPAAGEQQAAVVIAGAGPVGLMLAIELRLAGIEPIMLERLTEISEVPKGNGLFGHIVQALDYRGLLDPLRAESTYTGPVPGFSFGPLRLDFSGLPESPLHVLAIPQRRLERRAGPGPGSGRAIGQLSRRALRSRTPGPDADARAARADRPRRGCRRAA